MTDTTRILVGTALPPLTLPTRQGCSNRTAGSLPRIGRIACVLAALALPALGIAASDTLHRADGVPGATQAAAPVVPSDGAAASARKAAVIRIAALGAARDGGRP